jgi:hypothetical protein
MTIWDAGKAESNASFDTGGLGVSASAHNISNK